MTFRVIVREDNSPETSRPSDTFCQDKYGIDSKRERAALRSVDSRGPSSLCGTKVITLLAYERSATTQRQAD